MQQDDRNQPSRELLRAAVKEGRECHAVLRNYRKDGTLFWNDLTISPVRDDEGRVTHFVGIANDVTARIRAEQGTREQESRLRAVLDTAVDAIITIDEKGFASRSIRQRKGHSVTVQKR